MSSDAETPKDGPGERLRIPFRVEAAVYATGTFGNTSTNVVTVIVPLWVVSLGASPVEIGLTISARAVLPLIFAIHGGALMDRIGARRVLVVFGAIAALIPLLFPVLPSIPALFFLNMISGLASSMGWVGAQASVGQIMKGEPIYAGRMSFVLRFGHLSAPVLAGLAWDLGGAWGGFGLFSLWGTLMLISALGIPPGSGTRDTKIDGVAAGPITFRELMPRLSEYVTAFALLAIPAIALVIMLATVRMGAMGMQISFYVVYLEGLGYTGTLIGALMAASSVSGFATSISVSRLTRTFAAHWLLVGAVTTTLLAITVTPLLGGIFALLLAVQVIRRLGMGLAQPLMISILSQSSGAGNYGKGAGLRTTANRLVSFIVPILMGAIVVYVKRSPAFGGTPR